MPNGRPGDHPYIDMVAHGLDLEEPELAERLRAVDKSADLGVRELLSDLVWGLWFGPAGLPDDYRRDRMLNHLDTIERLCGDHGWKKT
jgi:hypothetical protein